MLRLICCPRDDVAFEAAVRELYEKLVAGAGSHESLVTAIVTALRDDYPAVRIRSRDPYVYRDGHPASTWS